MDFSRWAMPLGAGVTAAVGAVVWAAARRDAAATTGEGPACHRELRWVVFAPLVVGFATLALTGVAKDHGRFVLVGAGAAALWLAVAWGASRARSRGLSAALHGAPVLLALAAAVAAWRLDPPVASFATSYGGAAGSRDAPPIVLVVLDTVRADHLELYGYARKTMPELTGWARGALIVRRAVSPAGWTSPAHASIFSGLPVSLHGVHYGLHAFVTPPRDGIRWLPQQLAERGYRCIAITSNPLALPRGIVGFDLVLAPRRDPWSESTLGRSSTSGRRSCASSASASPGACPT